MGEETRERAWFKLSEPPTGDISQGQLEAIRDYAAGEGYETLRGYHMHLRSMGWDYYDVLKAEYR